MMDGSANPLMDRNVVEALSLSLSLLLKYMHPGHIMSLHTTSETHQVSLTSLSIYPSMHPSTYLAISLTIYLSIYLSICPSVCLSFCLFVYLSLDFQKWSEPGMLFTFWLRHVLTRQAVCTFSASLPPRVCECMVSLSILTSNCTLRHNALHFSTLQLPEAFRRSFRNMLWTTAGRIFRELNFYQCSQNEKLIYNILTFESASQRREIFRFSFAQIAPHLPLASLLLTIWDQKTLK